MGILDDIRNKKAAKVALVNDLENAKTLKDFFDICGKHFDVSGTKLGDVAKFALIKNIDKIIDVTGAKPLNK